MAKKKAAAKKKRGTQGALLECTYMYRVFVSEGIKVFAGKGNEVAMESVQNGANGAGQADFMVTKPNQIVAREGFAPDGKKAIFLVRVPPELQIFKPKK